MNFGEHQLVQRIKERYAMPEFVTIANVETPSGRYADAVALNLWRSRGYELIGFECKSVRGDWLREKANPEKAEGVAQFCKTFWIVANPNVVKAEELPLGWGLLEAKEKGLIQRVKATPLGHRREITVPMMVSIIRRAVEKSDNKAELAAATLAGRDQGIEEGLRRATTQTEKHWQEKCESFEKLHSEFEARTGVKISEYYGGKELALAWSISRQIDRMPDSLKYARETLVGATKIIDKVITEIKDHQNGKGTNGT
jgi:hypothetical protein